jgi:hypothetical protein
VTKHEARRTAKEAYANWRWSKQHGAPKQQRVERILEYRRCRALITTASDEVNDRGNIVYRDSEADARIGFTGETRYVYDHGLRVYDKGASGWRQYDTFEDAWYFGCWTQLEERKIFTYAEGDRTLVVCPTIESFRDELNYMADFYGDPPPAFVVISSDGQVTQHYDQRPTA